MEINYQVNKIMAVAIKSTGLSCNIYMDTNHYQPVLKNKAQMKILILANVYKLKTKMKILILANVYKLKPKLKF